MSLADQESFAGMVEILISCCNKTPKKSVNSNKE